MIILTPTPDARQDLIVVGTCVRKPPVIVRAYLASLASQVVPPGCRVEYHFIADQADPDTVALLHAFVTEHGGLVEEEAAGGAKDFDDTGPVTHSWTNTAMARVGQMKNRIIQRARDANAVAVWFVDADLICDDHTLRSLWFADKPIAHAVFWTRWQNIPTCPIVPQVWLLHPYQLQGRGYCDEAAFRRQLLTRQLTRVWGGGACCLIRRVALDAGVDYSYIPGASQEGMMAGEDRHFCIKAEAAHMEMYADPWPHIYHIYHPEQVAEIDGQVERLQHLRDQQDHPSWLNLSLKMLEPVQTGPTSFSHIPGTNVRVRVGVGDILPDLEAQCLAHLDGVAFTAVVHYPMSYVVAAIRGQRRLMEVTVVDYKGPAPMPVVEHDLPNGIDLTTYTGRQLESLYG